VKRGRLARVPVGRGGRRGEHMHAERRRSPSRRAARTSPSGETDRLEDP
jgi:hypothetical protein